MWSAVKGKDLANYAATDLADLWRAAPPWPDPHPPQPDSTVVVPGPHRPDHPKNLIKKDL
jgi:hypothetical protein